MSYSKICDLNGSKESWAVQVRLCRLWEAVAFKKNHEVFALEMVFVDAQGNSIQGYVRKNHITKFKSIFKENKVYNIRNFKVGKASVEYKVVPNSQRMYLNVTTSVSSVTSPSNDIPHHVFYFVPESVIQERIGDNTLLTDIIGCVVSAGPIQIVATGPKKDIELKSNEHGLMKLTLWGNITSMFDLSSHDADNAPVIAIVTSTTVHRYKGDLSFNSTTASRLFFNIDLPEVHAMSETFMQGYKGIKEVEQAPATQLPLAKQASLNRTTIAEILAMEWESANKEYFCTLVGEIVEVNERYGWCYVSCNNCSKKLVPENGSFVCGPCKKECCYPVIRYKLHARVSDQTGSTTVVIFNDDAERYIKAPATRFKEQVGMGDKTLPDEITKLIGKTFVFKLKVTDYNLKDGFENYTVTKIFEEVVQGHKRKVGDTCSTRHADTSKPAPSMMHPVTPDKKNLDSKKPKLDD